MHGEGKVWERALEDDAVLVIQCKHELNEKQLQHLTAGVEAALEGTGKRAVVLPFGVELAPPAGPVFLRAEQAGPRQPMRVFDQFGRELAGVRVVTVIDTVDDVRILQLELVEMYGEDYTDAGQS